MSNKASGTGIILITVKKVIYFCFLSFCRKSCYFYISAILWAHLRIFGCVCHCQNGFWPQLEISAPAALPRLLAIF